MLRLWWTIPAGRVAWEWRVNERRIVEADEASGERLAYRGSFEVGRATMSLPAGQRLSSLTGTFLLETNSLPSQVIFTWIEGRTAVRWDRSRDRWTIHEAGRSDTGDPVVGPPRRELDVQVDERELDPVWAAGDIACRLLGLAPIPEAADVLDLAVAENTRKLRARSTDGL